MLGNKFVKLSEVGIGEPKFKGGGVDAVAIKVESGRFWNVAVLIGRDCCSLSATSSVLGPALVLPAGNLTCSAVPPSPFSGLPPLSSLSHRDVILPP
ncbi:hypothetical protein L195_g059708, partial [Trifolium pratense]